MEKEKVNVSKQEFYRWLNKTCPIIYKKKFYTHEDRNRKTLTNLNKCIYYNDFFKYVNEFEEY